MRPLDFPVEVWAGLFYVQMPDAKIFAVPMELSLKFMTVISLDGVYCEFRTMVTPRSVLW